MEQLVYLNGSIIPRSNVKISPFDQGFLYGYGLFETMRSYSGRIFLLDKHLNRLRRSASMIALSLDDFDLERACYDTLKANQLDNARIRLTISAGENDSTPDAPAKTTPTVVVIAARYDPPSQEIYRTGYSAVVSQIRQYSQSPLSQLKSANYLSYLLARREARAKGADEALLLNERGFICEGSASNIFLVSGIKLFTPDAASGCLPGITRQVIIELASELNITVDQQSVPADVLFEADEVFITNSILELMPLREVDGKTIGVRDERRQGIRLVDKLTLAYKALVARETGITS